MMNQVSENVEQGATRAEKSGPRPLSEFLRQAASVAPPTDELAPTGRPRPVEARRSCSGGSASGEWFRVDYPLDDFPCAPAFSSSAPAESFKSEPKINPEKENQSELAKTPSTPILFIYTLLDEDREESFPIFHRFLSLASEASDLSGFRPANRPRNPQFCAPAGVGADGRTASDLVKILAELPKNVRETLCDFLRSG